MSRYLEALGLTWDNLQLGFLNTRVMEVFHIRTLSRDSEGSNLK